MSYTRHIPGQGPRSLFGYSWRRKSLQHSVPIRIRLPGHHRQPDNQDGAIATSLPAVWQHPRLLILHCCWCMEVTTQSMKCLKCSCCCRSNGRSWASISIWFPVAELTLHFLKSGALAWEQTFAAAIASWFISPCLATGGIARGTIGNTRPFS